MYNKLSKYIKKIFDRPLFPLTFLSEKDGFPNPNRPEKEINTIYQSYAPIYLIYLSCAAIYLTIKLCYMHGIC